MQLLSPDLLVALLWTACSFVAGVSYAAYRAVGWVDRMRSWAYSDSTNIDTTSTEGDLW